MKRVLLGGFLALNLLVATPAYADNGGYGQGDECGRNGGCDNHRRENYGDNSCKYVCPAFDKSPVQDSFNLNVCLPGATCYYGEPKKDGQGGNQPPPQGGQQPKSQGGLDPACLLSLPYHCDPKPAV